MQDNEEFDSSEVLQKAGKGAKNAAQKAKQAGQNLKAFIKKMATSRVFRWTVIIIAASIVQIILIASFYYVITGDKSNNATSSLESALGNTIGELDTDIINPTIKLDIEKDATTGDYYYAINYNDITEEEIEDVKEFLLSNNITDLSEANINFIVALVKNGYKLEKYGNEETLKLLFLFYKSQIASESLDLRKDTTVPLPNISLEDNKIQGIVKIQRTNIVNNGGNLTDNKTQLTYIPKSEFDAKKNDENINKYFSLNNDNLLVATVKKTSTEYVYEDGYTGDKEENKNIVETTNFNGEEGVAYKNLISKYGMTYPLLVNLMVYLEDTEFCENLANSVCKNEVILGLQEEEIVTITKEKYQCTETDKLYYDLNGKLKGTYTTTGETIEVLNESKIKWNRILQIRNENGWEQGTNKEQIGTDEDGSFKWEYNGYKWTLSYLKQYESIWYIAKLTKKQLGAQAEKTIDVNREPITFTGKAYTAEEERGPYAIDKSTTITYNQCTFGLLKISNWALEYERVYSVYTETVEGPTYQQVITNGDIENNSPDDETEDYHDYPKIELSKEEIGKNEYIEKCREEVNNKEEFSSSIWVFPDTKSTLYTKTNRILQPIEYIYEKHTKTKVEAEPIKIIKETPEDENGFLYYYSKSERAKDRTDARAMLFEQLEKNAGTVDMVNTIKYLLYKYDGQDYGVTELEISWPDLILNNEFVNVGISSFLEYQYQFSHSGPSAPMSANGKYYKMYGDGSGNPTIGNADLQWKSQWENFKKPGKVSNDGVTDIQVSNVADWVNKQFGTNGPNYTGRNSDIDNKNIYIEKELVDEVGENVWKTWKDLVDRKTEGLELSMQQKYALYLLAGGRGGNGFNWDKFREIYARYEKDSPEQLKAIWDEWWWNQGIKKDSLFGVIKGQDAMFETYVKGTMNFQEPWTPNWMSEQGKGVAGRKYYVFYTEEQLDFFNNSRLDTARKGNHDQEIFTYEGSNNIVNTVITLARAKLGCPYTNDYPGRIGPNSFDCSGLIYWLYNENCRN